MMTFKQMGLGLALVQVLTACGAAGTDELIDSVEQVGEVRESLNEAALDRPLVAAIMRYRDGDQELWVFACDQNNKMRRRVKAGGVWANWITVNSSLTCGSPPSVGKWERQSSNQPTEAIGVYWRDLSNQLFEVRYNADGTVVTTNLSEATGFGPIAGSPVVADATNRPGYSERFSVAVVKAGVSSELHTFDYYWSEWHTRPVLLATGATATVFPGTSIVASHSQESVDAMLSIQANAGAHFIFKRHFWSKSYTHHAWTASSPTGLPKGVISFIRGPYQAFCNTALCALIRSTSNRPMLADVIAGGNITNQFYAPFAGQPGDPQLGSSIRVNTFPGVLPEGATVLANGNLGSLWYQGVYDHGVAGVSSAPIITEYGAGMFFTVGAQRSLHYLPSDGTPAYGLGLDLAP